MRLLFLFIFLTASAHALEAVITVLEAPLFKYPSLDAPVVKYYRKGDVIKIHPSIANDRKFDQHAPSPEKLEKLQKKLRERPEYNQDPLFRGEEANTAYIEDEFIPLIDRQGHTAYVLSEHIFVYFNDSREFNRQMISKDPTDYRLEEPLPKLYPLKKPSGYRGQFILGFTQPYTESYPYGEAVRSKGYSSPVDAQFTLLRLAPGNYDERFFIGGTFAFRHFENNYNLQTLRYTTEESYRFGLGPTVSYDAFKGEKNRINISSTMLVNFWDQLDISQRTSSEAENRTYRAFSLSPRLSAQYHRKDFHNDLDFVLGTSLEVGLPATFRAKNAGRNTSWWQAIGDDKFTTRTTFTLGAYIGIQSAY
jgi:hypothetical protein